VLDNCEHLVEACARLADRLLRLAPGLHLLATSREALRIAAETTHLVPPLAVSANEASVSPAALAVSDAVLLFADRAAAVQPGFALDSSNTAIVADVCRRLEGIPLALELAAARVRSLPLDQLARRLDDRFRLLTGGSRAALERHQTLRAALDWSYHLLSEPEQALLQRLSVFAGGWTLDAAEAVAAGERDAPTQLPPDASGGAPASGPSSPAPPLDVLDTLTELVNKSLAQLDPGTGRYRLLGTIRQYAREKLDTSGQADDWCSRHLDFFVQLAAEAEPKLFGPDQLAWLDRLEAEIDNLRAALEWGLRTEHGEGALRLASGLWRFWVMRDYEREGLAWLQAALASQAPLSSSLRARALARAGMVAQWHEQWAESQALLDQALPLAREHGDHFATALSLLGLGAIAKIRRRDFAAGQARYEESLALFREIGHAWGIAMSLNYLRLLACDQGDVAAWRRLGEESAALFRAAGNGWDLARGVHGQGELARYLRDYDRAVAYYEEADALHRRLRMPKLTRHYQRVGLAYARLRQGDPVEAKRLLREALALLVEPAPDLNLAAVMCAFAGVALSQGQPARAALLLAVGTAWLETSSEAFQPQDQAEYDRDLAASRQALDEATFALAWAEGQRMTMEQAIACALEDDAAH
jgi:predicted ATPase